MPTEDMAGLVDRGPFPARAALEAGLVDDLLYRDEVEETLTFGSEKYQPVTVLGYQRSGDDGLGLGRSKIALIYGVGMIVSGESVDDPFVGRVMGSDTIAKAFRAVRNDDSIKAVVFRIDSPGGSDVASDVIWREASLTKEKKPVIVSMANVAASGGYWIATASDAILAEPTTLTGSIGIYAGKFNMNGFYEKIGFNKQRVMKGNSADFFSDTRNFTEEERQRFRAILEEGYRRFLEKVSTSRGKETSDVDAIAQGRVWTGAQALENGLVDELGGLDRAIALAKEKAGIPQSSRVQLELLPRKKSLIEVFIGRMIYGAPELLSRGGLDRQSLMDRSPVLRMLMEGQRLAVMPYRVELH
jgi:protease-4